jgi:hypothetical protein
MAIQAPRLQREARNMRRDPNERSHDASHHNAGGRFPNGGFEQVTARLAGASAMTMLVSAFGIAGRIAGDLMTSALGWASSLLFGRVPRTHRSFSS